VPAGAEILNGMGLKGGERGEVKPVPDFALIEPVEVLDGILEPEFPWRHKHRRDA
jgi:hypothetical protein